MKMKSRNKGHIFIISGPSGVGKTTLRNLILKEFPDILYSVSYTTRQPRSTEKQAVDYHFIDKNTFEENIKAGKWAEWAQVHGNYYGTSALYLEDCLAQNKDVLLDIDVQGTSQILKKFPNAATFFIMPRSLDSLKKRLQKRGSDSNDVIRKRLLNAEKEIAAKDKYTHVVINDELPRAFSELKKLTNDYRRK